VAERPAPDPKYGLGLPITSNVLVPHNELWAEAYELEAALISNTLGEQIVAIEHVGSTAVPGLIAKPIIDIQLGVTDMSLFDAFIATMADLGYDMALNHGVPEHHVFGRGEARTFLVHVVLANSEQWHRPLRFRDRLRADAALRDEYARLKQALARDAADRAAYTAGKTAFVEAHSN
jgi:GrpB-like predicted nucleotidyltransferase (UPF0157 family)